MKPVSSVAQERARLGGLTRWHADDWRISDARRALNAEKLMAHVQKDIGQLNDHQRATIVTLLEGLR
jgi:hypothetical protein